MARTLTAADRSALIRLASTIPAGSKERKAILKGLSKSSGVVPWHMPEFRKYRNPNWEDFKDHFERGREDEWFQTDAPMTYGFVRSSLVRQVARDPEVSAKKLQRIYEKGQKETYDANVMGRWPN